MTAGAKHCRHAAASAAVAAAAWEGYGTCDENAEETLPPVAPAPAPVAAVVAPVVVVAAAVQVAPVVVAAVALLDWYFRKGCAVES